MQFSITRRSVSDERWLPVVGYEGLYEVSDHGQVRSLDRIVRRGVRGVSRRAGQMLKPNVLTYGHRQVSLYRGGVRRLRQVHNLVLEAFVGPRPEGLLGLHWDDDPANNHISNLRWGTPRDNTLDMIRNGNHPGLNKTRCKRGHRYTAETTYINKRGQRSCRACRRIGGKVPL